jgi:Fur family ferric uptake transcriptional regulator
MRLTANRIAGILRKNGYKLTPQRHAVLRAIADTNDHLTALELYARVNERCPSIGKVTVYRLLEILSRLNLVCEVHGDGICKNYLMRRPTGHHHHLICSGCNKVIDFTDCDLTDLERRLAGENDFVIQGHLLEFHGLCHECKSAVPC